MAHAFPIAALLHFNHQCKLRGKYEKLIFKTPACAASGVVGRLAVGESEALGDWWSLLCMHRASACQTPSSFDVGMNFDWEPSGGHHLGGDFVHQPLVRFAGR